jgi:rhodanese-related sulfurtransferase
LKRRCWEGQLNGDFSTGEAKEISWIKEDSTVEKRDKGNLLKGKGKSGLWIKGVFFLLLGLCAGCYEGYVGPEGEPLKKYLEPAALKALAAQPRADIWIIDVRPEEAYRQGHIPTSKNFPSSQIMDRLGEIPKSQYLILVCETGGRAQMVAKKLEKAGYTRFMNGGAVSRYLEAFGKKDE